MTDSTNSGQNHTTTGSPSRPPTSPNKSSIQKSPPNPPSSSSSPLSSSSSSSRRKNSIQLEISTEDGGSMNIQRELTLEKLSLDNTTTTAFINDEFGTNEDEFVGTNNDDFGTNNDFASNKEYFVGREEEYIGREDYFVGGANNEFETNHHQEEEEENENNTSLDTEMNTSVITNSMSVITEVIDNYSSGGGLSWVGGSRMNTVAAANEGGVNYTTANNAGGEEASINNTNNVTTKGGGGGDVHTTSFQNAGTTMFDAVASFLSGGVGLVGGSTSASDTVMNTTKKSTPERNSGVDKKEEQMHHHHHITEGVQVDMLTGLVLDDDNNDDDDDMESRTTTISYDTRSHKDIVLDPDPSIASSVSGTIVSSSVNSSSGKVESRMSFKEEFEQEYHPLQKQVGSVTSSKNQVAGEGTRHNDDDEEDNDEVRNSNSDEYYQDAYSHENHHHGEVLFPTNDNDDDIREDSLVVDTLSSDWVPSVGPSSGDDEEERRRRKEVVAVAPSTCAAAAQSVLGTSMKSLLDGVSSSSTDSSSMGRVSTNQRGENVQGRQHEIANESFPPSTSISSQENPSLHLPLSSSSSAAAQSILGTSNKSLMDGSSGSSSGGSSSNSHHQDYSLSSNKIGGEGGEESSLNSDMMELQRGQPLLSPMAGDASRNSSMLELQRAQPMLSPMAGDASRNSSMMELQRGQPLLSPMAGDASRNSSMMEIQRGQPLLSPMAGDASRNSSMMETQRGQPLLSPMAGDASRNSSMMELQRAQPLLSPMAGDASRNSSMMEIQQGLPMGEGSDESINSDMMKLQRAMPMSPGRRRSIDDSMNSRMMKLQQGAPVGGEASTSSGMMELQHGLPMSPGRSDSPESDVYEHATHQDIVHSPIRRREEAIHTMAEALSLHHQYQPTPQSIIIDTNKPEIPDSYPSLMDALQSGSSFGSITTATQSFGIAMTRSHQLHDNGREHIDREAEEILNVQDDDDEEGRREESLTYTDFYNTHQKHQDVNQALEATPLPSSSHWDDGGNSDPRMNIDYQRHYIVDLQPINEEGTSASRSGVTPGGNPPREGDVSENHHQVQQQQLQPPAAQAANLHQQQQYHPMAPAPQPYQPNNQFFNYRHQYYQEKYQDDNETAQTSKYDDDTDSTCSSVTLSQAFQGSDVDSCESSVGLNSTVSSITFSHVDQHEHEQGFYVATKLGDFVHVPNEVDISEQSYVGDTTPGDANLKTAEEEKFPTNETTPTNDTTVADNSDEISNITAAPKTTNDDNKKQVGATSEDMASDLIAAIVPECGVPITSVMAKVGTRRRKSSNTGFLVPWHSSRSIQNYRFGYQRKKTGRQQQQRSSSFSSLFSIGSVHTFRG